MKRWLFASDCLMVNSLEHLLLHASFRMPFYLHCDSGHSLFAANPFVNATSQQQLNFLRTAKITLPTSDSLPTHLNLGSANLTILLRP
jgi:hypothetical protein